MDHLIQRLQKLTKKVARMEQLVVQLQSDNQRLALDVSNLKQTLSEKQNDYELLEERYEAVKLIKGVDSDIDSEGLKAKIDNYLKEIDICLKYFGVQDT